MILAMHPSVCSHLVLFCNRCQTYEGGFGGIPGMEAHGGYAFCALAALVLIDRVHLCDIKGLLVCLIFPCYFCFTLIS